MTNVVHLVHKYTVGGAESVLNSLCLFASPHIKNHVSSFTRPDPNTPLLPNDKCTLVSLDKKPGNDILLIGRLGKYLKKYQTDIVHAQGWGTYIEGLLALKFINCRRSKFIFAFHGKTLSDVQDGFPFRRRLAQKWASYFTDAIIAPSKHMADDYGRINWISPDKIRIIYNGIDLNRFSGKFQDSKQKIGLQKGDFVIGFVGRLDPVKNLVGLVKIYKMFVDKVPLSNRSKLRLLIVGAGQERENLNKITQDLGLSDQVVLFGQSNNVPLCLSAMDVYIQPSFYEGHSITILEAMASGLPIISTDVGGTSEIITNGATGFLFDPNDYKRMAMKLLTFFQNAALREKIGRTGRKKIQEKFSVKRMVQEYEKLYADLLQREV